MKTILVPIDFSIAAENAANYAAEFAGKAKASLTLFNVYSVPAPVADVPVVSMPIDEVEKDCMMRLKDMQKKLAAKYPNIETRVDVAAGFVVDEILIKIDEEKPEMVIMGVSNANEAMEFFGSNASAVIKRVKCPVLVIHKDSVFKKIEKIGLACDYRGTVSDQVVDKIKNFVNQFNAKLLVFDVLKQAEIVNYQKAVAEVNLENSLGDMEHSLYYPSGDDLSKELNEFVERNNVDILIMIPHNYPFWQKLFHHSHSKEMIFKSKVPLLTIHE